MPIVIKEGGRRVKCGHHIHGDPRLACSRDAGHGGLHMPEPAEPKAIASECPITFTDTPCAQPPKSTNLTRALLSNGSRTEAEDILRAVEAGDVSTLLRWMPEDVTPQALALWILAHKSIGEWEARKEEHSL